MQHLYKTIIVDDERPVRAFTKHILAQFPQVFSILGEATNGKEAIALIESKKPDLIFLDIQMPDISGFQVLEQIQHHPIVVFLTAYDHFAVKAFEENGMDYLLKPLDEKRLQKTILKLNQYQEGKEVKKASFNFKQLETLIQTSLQPQQIAKTITVKQGNKILLINLSEVAAFISTEKYTSIKTIDGRSFLEAKSLSQFEQELPYSFLRIQKGAIINTIQIKEIHKHFNNRYNIFLKDSANTVVLSGHTYFDIIKERLNL